jgi:hypothetical protein
MTAGVMVTEAPIPVRVVETGLDWPAWIAAISSAASLTLLVATAFFAWFALSDAKKTRHAQLILAVDEQWRTPSVQESIAAYARTNNEEIVALVQKLYSSEQSASEDERKKYAMLAPWANLVETVGALEHEGSIDCDAIYNMWGGGIIEAWAAWKDAAPVLREATGRPGVFVHFERLAAAMNKVAAKRAGRQATSA